MKQQVATKKITYPPPYGGGAAAESNAVDVSEQELLEKYPEVLRALPKDHSPTAYEAEK